MSNGTRGLPAAVALLRADVKNLAAEVEYLHKMCLKVPRSLAKMDHRLTEHLRRLQRRVEYLESVARGENETR